MQSDNFINQQQLTNGVQPVHQQQTNVLQPVHQQLTDVVQPVHQQLTDVVLPVHQQQQKYPYNNKFDSVQNSYKKSYNSDPHISYNLIEHENEHDYRNKQKNEHDYEQENRYEHDHEHTDEQSEPELGSVVYDFIR